MESLKPNRNEIVLLKAFGSLLTGHIWGEGQVYEVFIVCEGSIH